MTLEIIMKVFFSTFFCDLRLLLRNVINIFPLVTILLILMTFSLDEVLILFRRNLMLVTLGVKRLGACMFIFYQTYVTTNIEYYCVNYVIEMLPVEVRL